MKLVSMLMLFLTLGFFHEAYAQYAQSESTKIVRLEVDGKEVKKNYKVFFLSNDLWIEAEKTSTGFIIPTEVRNNKELTVLITFGKYKLEFPGIRISKFNEDWVVGVDNEPFSEIYVDPEKEEIETSKLRRIYYIKFVGGALETVLAVKIRE